MAERRWKGIKQGLPGDCDLTDLRDFTDGDMVQWSSSLYKWEVKAAADTIDLTANYVWTGTHEFDAAVIFDSTAEFNGQVDFDADVDVNSTSTFSGDVTFDAVNVDWETAGGERTCRISNSGIELGYQSTVNFGVLDFHTSGNAHDYDSRILASGGDATLSGYGTVQQYAGKYEWLVKGSKVVEFTDDGTHAIARFNPCQLVAYAPSTTKRSTGFVGGTAGTTNTNTEWFNSSLTVKAKCKDDGDFENANNSYGGISDRRRKRAIIDETNGLEVLRQLRPKSFIYNHSELGERRSGFIAQEIREHIPEAIKWNPPRPAYTFEGKDFPPEDDYYTLDLPALIPTIVNAVKELDDENRQMRQALRALRDRLDALEGV